MTDDIAAAQAAGPVDTLARPPARQADAAALVLGLVGLTTAAVVALAERAGITRAGRDGMRPTWALVPGAVAGLGGAVAARLPAPPAPLLALAGLATRPVRVGAAMVRGELVHWDARGRRRQERNEQLAAAVVADLIGGLVTVVLARVRPGATLPLVEAILRELPDAAVTDLVARALREVPTSALRPVVERVLADLPAETIAAVAGRVTSELPTAAVTPLVERVLDELDLDAVVRRVDLADLTEDVMAEVDMGDVIRQSTGTITAETVDAVRVQGMRADTLVARIVDRLLRRSEGRDLDLEPPPPERLVPRVEP